MKELQTITKEDIVRELQERGYNAKADCVIKNGVELDAITIVGSEDKGTIISPTIYTKELLDDAAKNNKPLSVVVEDIINIYENAEALPFNTDLLIDKDYVLNNIYAGLKDEAAAYTSTMLVTKPLDGFDGIECYLYIRFNGGQYTTKVSESILSMAGISVEEAWEAAQKNIEAETSLLRLADLMKNEYGVELPEDDPITLYVLTNTQRVNGAAALLNKEVLKGLCKKHKTNRLLVMPSSIHEVIIMPYTEYDESIEVYTQMVSQINEQSVDPMDRLINKAFIVEL